MYRLFCNNNMLICRNFSENIFDEPLDEAVIKTQSFENTRDIIEKWLACPNENIVVDDVDAAVFNAVLKTIFRQAPAAGGVVTFNNSVLAIERNGRPDLPKGHIEKDESPDMAALREVNEETSISNLKIIRQLPSTYHCYLLDGQWTMKKTSWFLMSTDDDFNPRPQTEEGISKVYLVNKDNVNEFLENTFVSLRVTLEEEILRQLGIRNDVETSL